MSAFRPSSLGLLVGIPLSGRAETKRQDAKRKTVSAITGAGPPGGGGRRQGQGRVLQVNLRFWQIFGKFSLVFARFRLYRRRFLQANMRFAAVFKIYQILKLNFLKFDKILQNLRHLQIFC